MVDRCFPLIFFSLIFLLPFKSLAIDADSVDCTGWCKKKYQIFVESPHLFLDLLYCYVDCNRLIDKTTIYVHLLTLFQKMKNENNFREWYKKFEVFVSLQVIKLYVAINTEYNYAGYVLLQFALLSYPMKHQKKKQCNIYLVPNETKYLSS